MLFIFLDGFGAGEANPEINPLCRFLPKMDEILGEGWKYASSSWPGISLDGSYGGDGRISHTLYVGTVDPVMGVQGLPQSATGQCSLITGRNCQGLIGSHWGPRPNRKIRELLLPDRGGTIFSDIQARGGRASFAAAFPESFFRALKEGRRIPSTLQQAFLDAGGGLATVEDLKAGRAISADITGLRWSDLGYPDIPVISPGESAHRLLSIAGEGQFTLYEYWLSDYIGHRGDFDDARTILRDLDAFLASLLHEDDTIGEDLSVIICSDHGNIEELSTSGHTVNPVPLIMRLSPSAGRLLSGTTIETIAALGEAMRKVLAPPR